VGRSVVNGDPLEITAFDDDFSDYIFPVNTLGNSKKACEN
jgi:hypothetical protein